MKIAGDFLNNLINLKNSVESQIDEKPSFNTNTCMTAIKALEDAYKAIVASSESGLMWRWVFSLSSDFLQLLNECDSAALAILGHYAVLVSYFEDGLWFLEGWSKAVIVTVEDAITDSWKQLLHWPKQATIQSPVKHTSGK